LWLDLVAREKKTSPNPARRKGDEDESEIPNDRPSLRTHTIP